MKLGVVRARERERGGTRGDKEERKDIPRTPLRVPLHVLGIALQSTYGSWCRTKTRTQDSLPGSTHLPDDHGAVPSPRDQNRAVALEAPNKARGQQAARAQRKKSRKSTACFVHSCRAQQCCTQSQARSSRTGQQACLEVTVVAQKHSASGVPHLGEGRLEAGDPPRVPGVHAHEPPTLRVPGLGSSVV